MKLISKLKKRLAGKVGAPLPDHVPGVEDAAGQAVPEVAQPAHWLAVAATDEQEDDNDQGFSYNPVELPLPNEKLRAAVSGPDLSHFLYIGHAWATICANYLPPQRQVLVLDVGCGVGKMARSLALNPSVHYVGFDIYLPAIMWSRREFSRLYGERFRFEHFDGQSAMYNPNGVVPIETYLFPVEDSSVDLALGASIFTHLYEKDMKHYFAETARVLKPGGIALYSIHTLDELQTFFPQSSDPGDKKIIGNEQVMLIDRDYFIELARDYGLRLHELPGRLCGQEVVAFQKPETR